MICIPKTKQKMVKALEVAQSIIERIEADRLTQVPLLYLDELPAISGIYFATTDDGRILYIGKADDLTQRCKLNQHHKLPLAIEKGATVLQVARVDDGLAWAVEQKLIAELSPALNDAVSLWWVKSEKTAKSLPKRKNTRLSLDIEVIAAFRALAESEGISLPKYVEKFMIEHIKKKDTITADCVPLSETRGGDRTTTTKGE